MPKHTCALCGQISFATYHEYETHRKEFHMLKTDIKPENVTGRSPRQIVDDAERTWLKSHLISTDTVVLVASNERQHLNACRCNECFNKKLDALIASQEASLKEQSLNDTTTN